MNRIEFGDCRAIMREWAAKGIKAQMCVTSPPYFGLRDYGHESQLGLEQTPEEYVAAMVEVFRCVREVLTDDGTLWLNIGDSYAGSGKGPAGNLGKKHNQRDMVHTRASGNIPHGCKPKDLIGIPWMLAFALRADGWYLRQDIIWHKPNPMPESVTDRCTKAHEYIFLLTKSREYYFDSEAIKEPAISKKSAGNKNHKYADAFHINGDKKHATKAGLIKLAGIKWQTRNRRSVWSVATKPYKGAHFATFPTTLIEPCILAGSRESDVVLDPFMGSGTTAEVAVNLGRRYIGCELNQNYQSLQQQRIVSASYQTRLFL
jgi:DNA modification methylase